jgi:hypothetical protein
LPIPPKSARQLAEISARLCRLLRDEVTGMHQRYTWRKRHKRPAGAMRRLASPARALSKALYFRLYPHVGNRRRVRCPDFAIGDSLAHAKDSPAPKAPPAIQPEAGLVRLRDYGGRDRSACRNVGSDHRGALAWLGNCRLSCRRCDGDVGAALRAWRSCSDGRISTIVDV